MAGTLWQQDIFVILICSTLLTLMMQPSQEVQCLKVSKRGGLQVLLIIAIYPLFVVSFWSQRKEILFFYTYCLVMDAHWQLFDSISNGLELVFYYREISAYRFILALKFWSASPPIIYLVTGCRGSVKGTQGLHDIYGWKLQKYNFKSRHFFLFRFLQAWFKVVLVAHYTLVFTKCIIKKLALKV